MSEDGFNPKAVLFDMDGVILDTEPVSFKGWEAGLRAIGYELTAELYQSIVGTNASGCKERLTAALGDGFDYKKASEIRGAYVRAHRSAYGIEVKKGVINLLDTLSGLRIPFCVATSTDTLKAEEYLKASGLGGRFTTIIGGDSVINGKPDPEIYLKAAAEMDASPEECLAIEDSRLGTEAAYRAGTKVILVPDMQPPDSATLARAFMVCKDLDEVAEILRERSRY